MDRERFEKQLNFILEIDKEKQILRQTHIRGYSRQEDDAEHAWHMAVMAFLLQEYSSEKIDIGRTMLMLLIHDLVEIDAGDTYAYDAEANKTKDEREHKAAERIYGLLPEDQGRMLMDLWLEFEAYETPEARFAHVMDNFQPLLLNHENDGKDSPQCADFPAVKTKREDCDRLRGDLELYGRDSRTEYPGWKNY